MLSLQGDPLWKSIIVLTFIQSFRFNGYDSLKGNVFQLLRIKVKEMRLFVSPELCSPPWFQFSIRFFFCLHVPQGFCTTTFYPDFSLAKLIDLNIWYGSWCIHMTFYSSYIQKCHLNIKLWKSMENRMVFIQWKS